MHNQCRRPRAILLGTRARLDRALGAPGRGTPRDGSANAVHRCAVRQNRRPRRWPAERMLVPKCAAMTPTENKNWLPLLLAATVALAGLVLWDWQSGDGASPAAVRTFEKSLRVPAVSLSGEGINPLANLALDMLHDTLARPLFERSRRPIEAPPPPPPVAPAHPAAINLNALSLLGVVASEGRTVALLKRNSTGKYVRAEVGDTVDGWTIISIEPQRVVIQQRDTRIPLELFRRKSSPSASPSSL